MRSVFLASLVIAAAALPIRAQEPIASCTVSPTTLATSPTDPNADPVYGEWYINRDRSIWVSVPRTGWPAGGRLYRGNQIIKGQKTYWVRPRGSKLSISGRRLDADAPPVEADIPCCYTSGFHIVALYFPTEGCWEVNAHSDGQELRFVTKVGPPRPPRGR